MQDEVAAGLVEACFRLALVPPTLAEGHDARMWMHDRTSFLRSESGAWWLPLDDRLYAIRHRLQGRSMAGNNGLDKLPQFMAQCARVLRLPKKDVLLKQRPTPGDVRRANAALVAMARISEPVCWAHDSDDDVILRPGR